jgi:hypothetical protein
VRIGDDIRTPLLTFSIVAEASTMQLSQPVVSTGATARTMRSLSVEKLSWHRTSTTVEATLKKRDVAKVIAIAYLGLWGVTATVGVAAARNQVDAPSSRLEDWHAISPAPFWVVASFEEHWGTAFSRGYDAQFLWLPGKTVEVRRKATVFRCMGP